MVRMPLMVLGGLAVLAASGPAQAQCWGCAYVQAQCWGCGYEPVHRQVAVRRVVRRVPRVLVRQAVVAAPVAPVVAYAAVAPVQFVQPAYVLLAPLPEYDRFGYAYGYRVVPTSVNPVVYCDPSYGLVAREW